MTKKIQSILFAVCIVMVLTAQSNRPDENRKSEGGHEHAQGAQRTEMPHTQAAPPAAQHTVQHTTQVNHSQVRPTGVLATPAVHRQEPQQAHSAPAVRTAAVRHENRQSPRVYATIPSAAPAHNNRFLHRQHSEHWKPRYNFYDNQYHVYPYVNVGARIELSSNYVSIPYDGQSYYYDQGAFYVQDAQGYLAVPPVVGLIVSVLPPGATQVIMNGTIYYQYEGVFYIPVSQGYQVVGAMQ